jgi:hypothetical protein
MYKLSQQKAGEKPLPLFINVRVGLYELALAAVYAFKADK